MLKKQAKKKHVSFHTPGHKRKGADITELSYSDNLAAPKGCILRAEKDIAAILGAKKSFILTDGSTCGVLSMLYAIKTAGARTVAFSLSAHKSVYNGCKLLGLTPLLLSDKVTAESIENEQYELISSADALFLTSPNYYGYIPDLEKIRAFCDREKKILLIDGAHGAHLHFDKKLYAGAYADMWVDGVHKNLPAYTQGAVVSARTEVWSERLLEGVGIFRTTSPSYPIMASVEYAVKYPRNVALEKAVFEYAKAQNRVRVQQDYTKLCVSFGAQASEAEKALQRSGIYPEFCDGETVMFYLSPATKKREFSLLEKTLKKLFIRYKETPKNSAQRNPAPVILKKDGKKEWVEFERAIGLICAENCGLFPPCTPLILAGERVEKEKVEQLKNASNVFGVIEGKMLVFTNENQEKTQEKTEK
jgi:lysine decarboxylase